MNVNQDETSTESQKRHLLHEIYFIEGDESSEVDTKIRIKQEMWDPNVASSDINYDASTLDPVLFLDTGTVKDGDVVDVKGEHFNMGEIPTESHKLHIVQNGTYFLESDENSEMDTKIGIKQETWTPNVVSSDINSDLEDPPTCIDTSTIKGDDGTCIREEIWWCDGTSVDLRNKEKEGNIEEKEVSKEIHPLESPRLPIYSEGNSATYLVVEKDGTCRKTACAKNTSQGTSMRQNISSLTWNPTCERASEQNEGNQHQSVCKCEICEKSYIHESSLKTHTFLHSSIKCDFCEKSFTKKSLLQRHTVVHSGTKPYKCDMCEKCFTQKSSLQSHTLVHSGTKPYKCDMCGKCFTRKSILKSHILVHSGTKPYKCDICEKCFTQKSHLLSHKVVHSGKKPHKCDICEKSYTQKSHLQTHTLVHSGAKSYKCEVCEKCFSYKSVLKSHALVHSGTNPYKCNTCAKSFTQKSHLQTHMFVHSGTKPYKCKICEKCFTDRSNLRRHTSVHSDAKPYKCVMCEKSFAQKSYLQSHTLVHSSTKPYTHNQFGTCFSQSTVLQKHTVVSLGPHT